MWLIRDAAREAHAVRQLIEGRVVRTTRPRTRWPLLLSLLVMAALVALLFGYPAPGPATGASSSGSTATDARLIDRLAPRWREVIGLD